MRPLNRNVNQDDISESYPIIRTDAFGSWRRVNEMQ
jgi:hypothetical protein